MECAFVGCKDNFLCLIVNKNMSDFAFDANVRRFALVSFFVKNVKHRSFSVVDGIKAVKMLAGPTMSTLKLTLSFVMFCKLP
jgi:hypothetical protein